ncbi:MAG: site-2 protease family protein [Chloroflexi bacterium]|nr:site-2 protease family protein [Chloroflexota bacterium]
MSVNDNPAAMTYSPEAQARALVAQVEDVFEVYSIRHQVAGQGLGLPGSARGTVLELTGRLLVPSERAHKLISDRFGSRGYLALLRRSPDGDLLIALPGRLPTVRSRVWTALALFLATLVSVMFAGSTVEPSLENPAALLSGWPFAASLLAILLAHEFGHYLVGRRLGIPSTLPYFIPMPLSLLGTLGAVIQIKAPPRNRRALLAVGAAGPLAGLAVALPLLVVGLMLSNVEVVPLGAPYFQEGNSLLYAALKIVIFGRFLPSGGVDVFLHPVAMAGWTGLLVTALNLIPAGQLDGGHIAYALFGQRARWLTWAVVAGLLGLSLLWNGWLLWAGLVFILGRVHAVPLDDVTTLRTQERALVILLFLVLALVFTPIPLTFQ